MRAIVRLRKMEKNARDGAEAPLETDRPPRWGCIKRREASGGRRYSSLALRLTEASASRDPNSSPR